uniref:RWP-RK domain-containing protein n=1 Tax=Hanusia phi TaxID=3032 RepID=A0A7S0EI88_9CRYP
MFFHMDHINANQEACKFDSIHMETLGNMSLTALRESMSAIPFQHELAHMHNSDTMAPETHKEDASSAISCTSSEHTSDFEEIDEVSEQGTSSRSLLVCPRKKKAAAAAAAHSSDKDEPVVITKKLLESLYGMPLSEVASKLKICPSAIRKACRRLGIEKWPFKSRNPGPKRKSISEKSEDGRQEPAHLSSSSSSSCQSARQAPAQDADMVEVKPEPVAAAGERKGSRDGGWNLDVSWIPHSSDFADDAEEAFWNNIQQAMNHPGQAGRVDSTERP